ncbi:MAG: hypothetical protein CM15mV107_030 [Caudoviricetes sp.]|nr:MAG: hypothetical protein CM15mV107_030 [Caudoviricetes sp.]
MQLRKLTVYGRLRQFLGQSHFEVAVNNPRQAFAFLIAKLSRSRKSHEQTAI